MKPFPKSLNTDENILHVEPKMILHTKKIDFVRFLNNDNIITIDFPYSLSIWNLRKQKKIFSLTFGLGQNISDLVVNKRQGLFFVATIDVVIHGYSLKTFKKVCSWHKEDFKECLILYEKN